jgi:hypothetical protein|tara:strand:+ start:1536 stop:1955 length:420 start_codon:yes stop_codon:yes gene_type:complete
MSHFAKIDNNNVVTKVIVAEQEFINSGSVGDSFRWVQTSYNASFRKNFASIGGTYDKTKDAFIAPKPYASWTLVEDTCQWTAPTAYPDDGKKYEWNESTTSWDEVVPPAAIAQIPPIDYPDDGKDYNWDDDTTAWIEIT